MGVRVASSLRFCLSFLLTTIVIILIFSFFLSLRKPQIVFAGCVSSGDLGPYTCGNAMGSECTCAGAACNGWPACSAGETITGRWCNGCGSQQEAKDCACGGGAGGQGACLAGFCSGGSCTAYCGDYSNCVNGGGTWISTCCDPRISNSSVWVSGGYCSAACNGSCQYDAGSGNWQWASCSSNCPPPPPTCNNLALTPNPVLPNPLNPGQLSNVSITGSPLNGTVYSVVYSLVPSNGAVQFSPGSCPDLPTTNYRCAFTGGAPGTSASINASVRLKDNSGNPTSVYCPLATTVNVASLPAWWQAQEGDIYGNNIQSNIPVTCTSNCYVILD